MAQTIAEFHSYTSVPFDIVVEIDNKLAGTYTMTVINNSTKVAVDIRKDVGQHSLGILRDELIYKWLLELAK